MFLQQAPSNKVPNQFKMGSLLSSLLCVDKTLVLPLN